MPPVSSTTRNPRENTRGSKESWRTLKTVARLQNLRSTNPTARASPTRVTATSPSLVRPRAAATARASKYPGGVMPGARE
jgi:hypothetical protein